MISVHIRATVFNLEVQITVKSEICWVKRSRTITPLLSHFSLGVSPETGAAAGVGYCWMNKLSGVYWSHNPTIFCYVLLLLYYYFVALLLTYCAYVPFLIVLTWLRHKHYCNAHKCTFCITSDAHTWSAALRLLYYLQPMCTWHLSCSHLLPSGSSSWGLAKAAADWVEVPSRWPHTPFELMVQVNCTLKIARWLLETLSLRTLLGSDVVEMVVVDMLEYMQVCSKVETQGAGACKWDKNWAVGKMRFYMVIWVM